MAPSFPSDIDRTDGESGVRDELTQFWNIFTDDVRNIENNMPGACTDLMGAAWKLYVTRKR